MNNDIFWSGIFIGCWLFALIQLTSRYLYLMYMKQKYAKIGLKFIKCSKCGTLFTGFIFETGKLCSKCGILKIAKQEYEKE